VFISANFRVRTLESSRRTINKLSLRLCRPTSAVRLASQFSAANLLSSYASTRGAASDPFQHAPVRQSLTALWGGGAARTEPRL
jgi:hypothetical protein